MSKNPHAVALGRKGGKATTVAKADAARANGTKGGRPIVNEGWTYTRNGIAYRLRYAPSGRVEVRRGARYVGRYCDTASAEQAADFDATSSLWE